MTSALSHDRAPSASPVSVAIVQWTHTLRMQNALLLARQQVLRTRTSPGSTSARASQLEWGHHVLLQSCGRAREVEEADCRNMTATLAARGLVENVSCYTSVAMGEALPALANIRNVFEHRGPHATNLTVGSYRWCWHSCDGAYLTFYAREQSRLSHYDYFWLLEWDVVWTGSLPAILAAWSVTEPPASGSTALAESLRGSSAKFWTPLVEGLPLPRGKDAQRVLDKYRDDPVVVDALREHGGRAPTRVGPSELRAAEDLICPNPAEVSRRWQHSPKRNYSLVHQNATRMCVTEVTRMSARLLREVVAFGQRRDAGMFCEMRAPVVCQRLPWCSVRSLFDSAHEQYLFANRTLWVRSWGIPTFGLSSLMDTGTGRTKTDRDVLYHAYKWPQKGFDPPRAQKVMT